MGKVLPELSNKVRGVFLKPTYLSNIELDLHLRAILNNVRDKSPQLYPAFSAMYYCGCRASESINSERWQFDKFGNVILSPLKGNNNRFLSVYEIPFEFLIWLQDAKDGLVEYNYERLRYAYQQFSRYNNIFIGNKSSTLHLFRHNYVKKQLALGLSAEDIRIKLGERNMKSAMSYIDSTFRI